MKRKICVVTGTRAEYGLLAGLMREIESDLDLDLQVIATCMHLSPEFGLTYRQIEEDGFVINEKIDNLLPDDTPAGVAKSMGFACIGLADAYRELAPDIVVLLGDRFETLSAACTATVGKIPVAHIHGGEISEGAMDDSFRHAITKMSHLHFTATEEYHRRVIQLGEHPERVWNVGALGVENISVLQLLNRSELEEALGFSLGERCAMVTFHPVTLEKNTAAVQFQNLLDALDEISDMRVIFTYANADTEGRIINAMIEDYVSRPGGRAAAFQSMGQVRYLSALQHVSVVVGNSSSGIIEAPSFKVPTVNIGDRQKGRVRAESVIDCQPAKDAIVQAIKRGASLVSEESIKGMRNPYEKDNTAENIKEVIKKFDLRDILKKEFFNVSLPDSLRIS